MGENSKIEWTHHTFNPWRGCTKVSSGCLNCYAETLSHRNPAVLGEWGPNGTRIIAAESMWRKPHKWDLKAGETGERYRVFCASLADVFEDRPELVAPRARLWQTILYTPNLDWLLLTKRPENIIPSLKQVWQYQKDRCFDDGCLTDWIEGSFPPTNVWLGTSIEDQATADERIPHLLRTPARVRFLSIEPLLAPVDPGEGFHIHGRFCYDDPGPAHGHPQLICEARNTIHWVIVGGESGPKARPMNPYWARSLRNQCVAAGVPFFFKQWGEWLNIHECGHIATQIDQGRFKVGEWHQDDQFTPGCICGAGNGTVVRVGKKAAGRLLDGREWNEFPEVPHENPR